ncbi:MAG: ABC transporter ATP-binding protein [Rhodospirillaceae bacterium]|nr:ABC transporter ATP-binding protein [Rhodospirillaceae bacterium]
MSALLDIRALHLVIGRGRRTTPILRGIDLAVAPGEVHGLVGESGAGKTMVGKVVLGIQPEHACVTRGTVAFAGRDITHLGERARRSLMGTGIALIPQDPMTSLNPAFTVGSQLTDVIRLHLGLDRKAAMERALQLLADVHIRAPARVIGQYPHELSGGMRQRILIAIAFSCRPKLIIADEPTTALDVTVQRQVLRLIRDLQRDAGTAILFVTHDLGVVAKLCEKVTVLHAGRVVEHGPVAAVIERPSHPYTQALMKATPRYDRPGEALVPVPASLTRALLAEAAAYDAAQEAGHA